MNLAIAKFLRRRTLWFVAVKVILSFMVFAYAANITITTTLYHAENGGLINVTNTLTAMDKGLSKAASSISAAGTSCGSNVTFTGTPAAANTALTANNFIYTIQVNTTATTAPSTCFTMTLTISIGGTLKSNMIYLATEALPTAGETIDCKFDIGSSLPTSPYTFQVTVQ